MAMGMGGWQRGLKSLWCVVVASVLATVLVAGAAPQHAEAQTGCTLGAATSTNTTPAQAECDALVALYNNMNGPNWTDNTGWTAITAGGQTDPCTWHGLTCLNQNSKIIWLNLSSNGLVGSIPVEVGDLSELERLDLAVNSLTGSIPPEVGLLANLQVLILAVNSLTGSIPPELGDLANMYTLNLAVNGLTGSIPSALGSASNISDLWLNDNDLSGVVPASLIGLPFGYSSALRLQNNGCLTADAATISWMAANFDAQHTTDALNQGCAPSGCTLGSATSTNSLLSQTECDGLVALYNDTDGPNWDSNTGWTSITAGGQTDPCGWTGVSCVGGLLTELDLTDNLLSGSIPVEVGDLATLEWLSLEANSLSGAIPASLGQLTNLRELYLGDTSLSGSIPVELGQLARLETLILINNNHSGSIPVSLGQLADLKLLALSGNSLSGSIPASLGQLASLDRLYLNNNDLSGVVPSSLMNLPLPFSSSLQLQNNGCLTTDAATEAWMAANFDAQYTTDALNQGCAPTGCSLGAATSTNTQITQNECDALVAIYTSTMGSTWTNNTGWTAITAGGQTDPCAWYGNTCASGHITKIELKENGLQGSIPPEVDGLSNLQILNLSHNSVFSTGDGYLRGEIPAELGALSNLLELNLSSNNLSGEIPVALGDLSNLQYLNLGNNYTSAFSQGLSGSIPAALGSLTNLEYLDLSWSDNLSGPIPASVGQLADLEFLYLGGNSLSGPIPASLGQLVNLQEMWLAHNNLSGVLPPSITSLTLASSSALRLQLNGCLSADVATEAWLTANFDAQYTTDALNQGCPASGFFTLAPQRLLDSRVATQSGEYNSPWGPGVTRSLQVGGLAGVPSSGVDAVAVHVTTVNPVAGTMAAASWLNAFASDEAPATTAVHNFGTGDFTSELVNDLLIVGVGADGKIMLSNAHGEVDLVIDVVGYFADGGDAYVPTTGAVRIIDSRSGPTNIGDFFTPWAQAPRSVTVAGGATQVPAGATAVAIHVTTVNPVANTMAPASWLNVYPTGDTPQTTAVHNFGVASFTSELANDLIIAKIGDNGQIDIVNAAGEVDLVIDIVGYFEASTSGSTYVALTPSTSGSTYVALTPKRVLDTRSATPVGAGMSVFIQDPAIAGCQAVAMHVTTVNPVADTMAPASWLEPVAAGNPAAVHNFGTAAFTTELVNDLIIGTVKIDNSRQSGVMFTNETGEVDLVVDIVGVFDTAFNDDVCTPVLFG